MLFLCLTAWLLTTQLHFVTVQGVECPVCTDKYDHNSCTQTLSCGVDVNYCELMVKPDDFYSLEYVCKKALDCTKQATDECHPTNNETCIYCCEGPTICQIQRDHLYYNQFPSSGLLVPSTTTAGPLESTSAKLSASTSTGSHTVLSTIDHTVLSTVAHTVLSTVAHTTTTTTTTSSPSPEVFEVIECPVCSDTYDHTSCSAIQKCSVGNEAVCQLVVHTNGPLRLEYQCGHLEVCGGQEAAGCHPEVNDTCVYCCEEPITCQLQRNDLFLYEFLHLGLLTQTTTPESPATSKNPSTTASTGGVRTSTPTVVITTPTPTTSLPANSVVIECPVCSDAYDHTTCSGLQNCIGAEAVCQLVIHTSGQLQLKYQCGHFEVCGGQEAAGCHPEVNDTCVYCCTELLTCQLQRDDLFTYELPSLGIATDISATTAVTTTVTETERETITIIAAATTRTTKTATTTTTEAATETTARATEATVPTATEITAATTITTETTATEATTTETTTKTTASTPETATETTTETTTATPPTATETTASTPATATASTTQQSPVTTISPPTAIRCLQCGNFANHIPCTQYEIAVNSPKSCPGHLPFCFTSFIQNGIDVVVYKGCATENFCNSQYEESSTKNECKDPDFELSKDVSCGYCCNRHYCNTVVKPDESSLVVFP